MFTVNVWAQTALYGVNQTDASSVWDGEKKKQLLAIHPHRK